MLKLIDEDRGVILFTAHVGNWEWLSIAMGLFSRPTSVLQRERGEAEIGRYITEFRADRKSTRLNSSHSQISYAVFCLKKKINRWRVAGGLNHRRLLF